MKLNVRKTFLYLAFARECIYYEMYRIENRDGGNNYWFPAVMVAIFDTPLIVAVAISVGALIFNTSYIDNFKIESVFSINGLVLVSIVGTIEYLYYRLGSKDIKAVLKFYEQPEDAASRRRKVALIYGVTVFLVGIIAYFYALICFASV